MALPAESGAAILRPRILGHRGAPREAPENTLASLRRALELALDGVLYDVRACAGGELVLLADASLDRTSDAHGLLAERGLPELVGVDAGGWFERRFVGEPLALLDEALELESAAAELPAQHVALLREPGSAAALARTLRGVRPGLALLVASRQRSACQEARELGLASMLVVDNPNEEVRAFARDERLRAVAAPVRAWVTQAGSGWPCERWSLDVDDPAELVEACRMPLDGLTTRAGPRALALRSLAALAPGLATHPLEAPLLPLRAGGLGPAGAQWCGTWELDAAFQNPFPRPARVRLELVVRLGTFEAEGLPAEVELAPRARAHVGFRLTGGSWSPGGDPLLVAHLTSQDVTGRVLQLALDAPLRRVRELAYTGGTQRLELLREHPGDPPASMTLRRRGMELLLAIESAGGLEDASAVAHLDGRDFAGSAGLRLPLPPDCDVRPGGIPFSAGMVGRARGLSPEPLRTRRWAGGLPAGADAGVPGLLRTRS